MVPTAAAPTPGRTDFPCDGGYCTFRPRGMFEAWGRVNWWADHNKDLELGRTARVVDLVIKVGLKVVFDGSVNWVREIA